MSPPFSPLFSFLLFRGFMVVVVVMEDMVICISIPNLDNIMVNHSNLVKVVSNNFIKGIEVGNFDMRQGQEVVFAFTEVWVVFASMVKGIEEISIILVVVVDNCFIVDNCLIEDSFKDNIIL
jgi:hypothetical protein